MGFSQKDSDLIPGALRQYNQTELLSVRDSSNNSELKNIWQAKQGTFMPQHKQLTNVGGQPGALREKSYLSNT